MRIVTFLRIKEFVEKHSDADIALRDWYKKTQNCEWKSFSDIKETFNSADYVRNNRFVFNIKGNDFRLVVSINFLQTACYVIWFGTHKEYDKINVETVAFDTAILNYKKL